nr:MAG TPA: helix-turn-helix domain protein [Caudoviricetes sp.]
MTDTELLRKKMENSGYRFNWIAKQLSLTPYGLRKKVNGENEFKASEIVKFQKILKISNIERDKIFFG